MAKQTRTRSKFKKGHRARKPRAVRPLDKAIENNHAARHEAAKVARAAIEADRAKQEARDDSWENGGRPDLGSAY